MKRLALFSLSFVIIPFISLACSNEEVYLVEPPTAFDLNREGRPCAEITWFESGIEDSNPIWSPDGTRIAFEGNHGCRDIYVMDSNGGNVQQLTESEGWDYNPAWSPNGKYIAFIRSFEDRSKIFLATADGTDVQQLSFSPGTSDYGPVWSPNGEQIAFIVSALNAEPATSLEQSTQIFSLPESSIFVSNLNGSNIRQLTTNVAVSSTLQWSPDGKKIAFASKNSETGNTDILSISSDGVDARPVLLDTFEPSYSEVFELMSHPNPELAWSPDGKRMIISLRHFFGPDGENGIYVMDADGTNINKLLDTDFIPDGVAWSPDGAKIFFHGLYYDGNKPNLERWSGYEMNADGSNLTALKFSFEYPDHERVLVNWSPNFDQIAFTKDGIVTVAETDGSSEISRNCPPVYPCYLSALQSLLDSEAETELLDD